MSSIDTHIAEKLMSINLHKSQTRSAFNSYKELSRKLLMILCLPSMWIISRLKKN